MRTIKASFHRVPRLLGPGVVRHLRPWRIDELMAADTSDALRGRTTEVFACTRTS
jgi:hypothetical protein